MPTKILIILFSLLISTAHAEDGEWAYYSEKNPFIFNAEPAAGYINGYDEFYIYPDPVNQRLGIYVTYWDTDLETTTGLTATLTLPDGTTGTAEYELADAFKDWQGTHHLRYALHYDDLKYFKQAQTYKLEFEGKTLTIPMSGFSTAIQQAIAAVE